MNGWKKTRLLHTSDELQNNVSDQVEHQDGDHRTEINAAGGRNEAAKDTQVRFGHIEDELVDDIKTTLRGPRQEAEQGPGDDHEGVDRKKGVDETDDA